MKKEKKFLQTVFSSLCAIFLSFGVVSCAGGDDSNNTVAGPSVNSSLAAGGSYSVLSDGTSAGRKAVTAPSAAGTIQMSVAGGSATTYSTIQAALTAAASASGDCVITLGKGTYSENGLTYSGSNNLKISGQGTAEYGLDVVILGQGSDTSSEKGRSTLAIAGSGNIVLENLTIKSSRAEATGTAQAEVIGTDGTGNLAAYNCSFISGQDTLRTVAKAWFYKCYIEGDVDFLWMEYTNGVAALYEECVLRAIGTRTTKAYFTAPRLGLTSKVGKGLVVYNCTLEAESGLEQLYLGRNPWAGSSDYYEQVAIVGSKLYLPTGVTLHSDVWASAANGTSDQKYIGFKTDDYFPAGKYGTRLDSSFIAQEYAGRENILNRLVVVATNKFQKDVDTYWDIAKVISDNNWSVTADSSKSLLSGETDPSALSKTYDFSTADSGAYVDSTVTINGFSIHSSGTASGATGKTITIPISGKCVVTIKGCYSGWGTIKAGSQGEGVYNINSGSTSKYLECSYIVYDSSATSVVITAGTTSYIRSITVEKDDSLSYTAVSGITVSSSTDAPTVGVAATMTATVTPDTATNRAVKWTSSDETVGTIDEYSGEVKFLKAGNVTFTATARDGSGKSNSVTLSPVAATWTKAEWYDSKDSSSSSTSGSGTGLGGAAGTNNSVFDTGSAGGVTLGGVKSVTLIDGTTASISTGLKMNSSGKITFSVTKAAKVTVMTGYCSDANATSDTCAITTSDGTATPDSSNPTTTPTADATYIWTLTAGTYTVGRAGSGYAPSIYYVRVDITE